MSGCNSRINDSSSRQRESPPRSDSDLTDSSTEVEVKKVLPKCVAILGARGVGKTALAMRVAGRQKFEQKYIPTIEDEHKVEIEVDGITHVLTLLDTAGQSQTTSLNAAYMLGVDGYVLVFNVASAHSFHTVKIVNEKLMYQKWADKTSGMAVVPRALVGNYMYVVGPKGEGREVSYEEAQEYASDHGIEYFECSAFVGGVPCRTPFENLVRVCHQNWMGRDGRRHKEEEQKSVPAKGSAPAVDPSVERSPGAQLAELTNVQDQDSDPSESRARSARGSSRKRGDRSGTGDGGVCALQ